MKRRDFIVLLGGTIVGWPRAARAQQPVMPIIGFLDSGEANAYRVAAFRQGLADAGYIEGRNVAIEFRWANAQFAQLRPLADDLVRHQVALIVAAAAGTSGLAAKAATSTIPIVIATGVDPVRFGLVDSLNRPGGNVTGLTYMANELAGKRLDLLHELVPNVTTIAYLAGGQQFALEQEDTSNLLAAAQTLERKVIVLECRRDSDLDAALAALSQRRAGALIVGLFPLAWNNRRRIIAFAARHKIPAIYPGVGFTRAGGLMSYAAPDWALFRQVAVDYVGKILKGAKPADLPVQRPTKFEFVVNLATAKALGIDIPPTMLALADEVIE
jgi:putative ABC transport system substrate-binding protein